jgi:uncharacterized protein (TIGR02118 family)
MTAASRHADAGDNMTKMIFVARKRADITEDEFITYWQQIHAPLAAAIPGIRQYVIYPVMWSSSVDPVCDGLSEMWFDSRARLQEGLTSSEGRRMFADLTNFCSRDSGAVVVDEIVILGAGAAVDSNRRTINLERWDDEGGLGL